ncbi:MAG: hypothetical protein JXK93_14610 [Sphaerochaetaceae bacterium]|nr:hypothetical protein [Sphaerochaetaceae bacterium]
MATSYYIPEVEKEVAEVDRRLLALYARLSETNHHSGFTSVSSASLYESFRTTVSESDEIKNRIVELRKISEALKEGNTRIEDLEREIRDTESRLQLLHARLGAILWEESVANGGDVQLNGISDRIGELQDDLRKLLERTRRSQEFDPDGNWANRTFQQVRSVALRSLQGRKKKRQDQLFSALGQELIAEGKIGLLKSDATESIRRELDSVGVRSNELTEEKNMIQESVHHTRHTLEKEEGRASLQHRINELTHAYQEAMKRRHEAASAYGRYLSTIIDLSSQEPPIPPEIVECQQEILQMQDQKKALLLTIKQLSIEKKIEEQVLLIRQDEEHIAHIEEQVGQLHRQIEEVRREMQVKQDQIALLQRQHKKLLPQQLQGAAGEPTAG